jgi:hypothetical protein
MHACIHLLNLIHVFTHSFIHFFTPHKWAEKLQIALREIRYYTLHGMVINPSAQKVKYIQHVV